MRLMGEATTFRRSLQVEVRDAAVSPHGGLVLLREFEERSGFLGAILAGLTDLRRGTHVVHSLAALLRLAIYRIVLGLPDILDAEFLRHDPVLRSCLAPEAQDRLPGPLPGKSTLHRFLTGILPFRANRRVLWQGLVDSAIWPLRRLRRRPRRVYVDLDSTEIEAHGQQEGARNNGHFRSVCFHPLVLTLAPFGTTLGFLLRPGNVHSAKHARAFVLPLLLQLRQKLGSHVEIVLRADSAFAMPELLRALEAHGFYYIIRMRSNPRLAALCEPIARRPPGRPPLCRSVFRYHGFSYRAGGWDRARRVVARSEFAPGELFPETMLLCVHLPERMGRAQVARTYLQRCQSEQVNDIFKNELHGSLMSHHRMVDNQVRAWLTALAKNLLLAFELQVRGRQRAQRPATVRARLLCIAATCIRHARSLVLRLCARDATARVLARAWHRVQRTQPPPHLAGV